VYERGRDGIVESQTTATGPGEETRIEQKMSTRSNEVRGIRRGRCCACMYDRGVEVNRGSLVQLWKLSTGVLVPVLVLVLLVLVPVLVLMVSVVEVVATSNVAQARQVQVVGALGVGRADSGPAARRTEADGVGRVVTNVDYRGVGRLSVEVLERALVRSGRLAVDLDLITTIKGRDPVRWPGSERSTTGDTDVSAGMIDRELASSNIVTVVAAELRPLEDVDTVRDPGRNLHGDADAGEGVAGVEAGTGAVPRVALALEDVLILEEILLILRGDIVLHGVDESHLNEATIVVVPPPINRDLLAALEVVLVWDIGAFISAGILVRRLIRRIRVLARSGEEHVRVGDNRRGGEERSDNDVPEHRESVLVKNVLEKDV